LKIKQAFPGILRRQYPIVKAQYPLLTVLYLLRMKDVDAVPIFPVTKVDARAVFRFSSLPRIMNLSPGGFVDLLKGPCEAASDELALVSVEEDLESLLDAFASRRLGFALVHDGRKTMRVGLASLADVLALYGKGAISTDMTVDDICTPIFSMPGKTTIRKALQAMFRHRYRRIFLPGKKEYVSDRSVMSHLFSPTVLEELSQDAGSDALSMPIAGVEPLVPIAIRAGTNMKTTAFGLGMDRGGCLATRKGKVVTPWDAVMKPWLSGRLVIA
jgi:hypothetical protein